MFDRGRLEGTGPGNGRTPGQALADRIIERDARIRAEDVGAVLDAKAWLDLHSVDPNDPFATGPAGGAGKRSGSDGTPIVDEHAVYEYARLRHWSELTARRFLLDVTDLEHRFPKLWTAMTELRIPVWQARMIAAACRELSQSAAAIVDAELARKAPFLPWGRIVSILGAAIMRADPARAEANRLAAKQARYVALGRSEDGLKTMIVRAEAGDLVMVYALVDRLAEILELEGSTETADQRRATAFGLLAQPAEVLALLLRHTHDAAASPGADASSPPDTNQESGAPSADRSDPEPPNPEPSDPGTPDLFAEQPATPVAETDQPDDTTDTAAAQNATADSTADQAGMASDQHPGGHHDTPDQAPHQPPDDPPEPPPWTADDYHEPDPPPDSRRRRQRPPAPDPEDPGPAASGPPGPADGSGLRLDLPGLAERLTTQGMKAAPPRIVMHVFLTDTTLATGHGVVRTDDYGPILAGQLREFLGKHSCHISLRPVLDPDQVAAVDAYEIPDPVRDAVVARQVASIYPDSTATSRHLDLDHTDPYRTDGGAGQTGPANLGPLNRGEHNSKTHGRWTVTSPHPGVYLWRSPHGYHYLVTNQGTQHLGRLPG